MLTEDSPLTKVMRKSYAEALGKNRGLHTVGDLLEHVPRRYLSPGELTDLAALRDGDDAFVIAEVSTASSRSMRNRKGRMLNVVLADELGGHLDLTFFNAFGHERALRPGARGAFWGTVGSYRGRRQLAHPQYELFATDELEQERLEHLQSHRIPVYPTSGGLTSPMIHRTLITVLDSLDRVRDPVPEDLQTQRRLVPRARALDLVHRPRLDEDPQVGLRRLKYDEALVLQAILAQRRAEAASIAAVPRVPRPGGLLDAFDARLPFELTQEQVQVGEAIAADLSRDRAMNRLLQGEVGSGKTVVALRAMLAAVDAGGQAALLAPTEVLAAQHHRSIEQFLGELADGGRLGGAEHGTRVALLTGSLTVRARQAAMLDVVTGEAGIVVGTHALIQDKVEFQDLALVVVDEQHRFGVQQRDALRDKAGRPPHVLVMTATPIPRTVAMTVFGDMDTSTIRRLPEGRAPIQTFVVDAARPGWVDRTWRRVAEEVGRGHQAYVVCPRIGEEGEQTNETRVNGVTGATAAIATANAADETDDADLWDEAQDGDDTGVERRPMTGVYDMLATLRANPDLQDLRIGLLHGRLDADTKAATMRAFTEGRIDVLVSTTVIEVGVDVPNATVMVICDAERFGISQLHQLRGRVGRGGLPGLCLLMTDAPGPVAMERLEAVASTTDGFALAGLDLQLRREGDILGARQSGRGTSVRHLRLGFADDEQIIADAREDASALVAADAALLAHPALAAAVAMRIDEDQAAYLERG